MFQDPWVFAGMRCCREQCTWLVHIPVLPVKQHEVKPLT